VVSLQIFASYRIEKQNIHFETVEKMALFYYWTTPIT